MSSIYTAWKTEFDIPKLEEHLRKYVVPLEAVQQSDAFGGWSVLSSDGDYKDGWMKGHRLVTENQTPEQLAEKLRATGMKPLDQYVRPTQICHGYLGELIDYVKSCNLKPQRARIIRLSKGKASIWHRDAPDGLYFVRLHVPIVTNPGCFFETETEQAHLPADGTSYFLRVNRLHRVRNDGDADRFHLVIDVDDTAAKQVP